MLPCGPAHRLTGQASAAQWAGLRRDPTCLDLSLFQSLSVLELHNCDLSTAVLQGVPFVRASLRSLTCKNSLEELCHLLAPASSEPAQGGLLDQQPDAHALFGPHCNTLVAVCKAGSVADAEVQLAGML